MEQVLQEEVWKQIIIDNVVYENYFVSNFGNVRKKDRLLKKSKEIYLQRGNCESVHLRINKKNKYMKVHRLVATAFKPIDLHPPVSLEIWQRTPEEVKNSFVAVETQMMSFGNTLTSALILAADAFSNLAVQGETDMKKMASAALQAARQVVSAYIKEGVAGIVKNILAGPTGKVLGPFAIAVAGAAGAGASVLFNTLLNKVSAPALAQGGLATGPTMALVGDNRNARVECFEDINIMRTDALIYGTF